MAHQIHRPESMAECLACNASRSGARRAGMAKPVSSSCGPTIAHRRCLRAADASTGRSFIQTLRRLWKVPAQW